MFHDEEVSRLFVLFSRGGLYCLILPALLAWRACSLQEKSLARIESFGDRALAGLAVLYFFAVMLLSSFKGRAHHTYADMATHLEIFWRAGHGLGLTTALSREYHHGEHWFAAHFTPISYLLVPLFRVFPYAETLHFVQTTALMSSLYPLVRYAQEKLGRAAASWAGVMILFYPTLHYINLYEFEYLRFSIPALAWAFYAAHAGRDRLYVASVCAALLTREDVSLAVIALGIYVASVGRRKALGAATAAAALAYCVAAVKWVMPSYREYGAALGLVIFSRFGASAGEIFVNVISRPVEIVTHMFEPMKTANLMMHFLPLSFTPLLGLPVFLVALPTIGLLMLNQYMTYTSFILYYLSPAIPFLFFASVDGCALLIRALEPRVGALRARMCVMTFTVSCAAVAAIWFGALPFSLQFWLKSHRVGVFYTTNFHVSNYIPTAHTAARNALVAAVPREARVAAEQPFLPHLFDRREMLCFPDDVGRADYALFDRGVEKRTGCQKTFLDFRNDPERYYLEIESDPATWELVMERDGGKLFRRRKPLRE